MPFLRLLSTPTLEFSPQELNAISIKKEVLGHFMWEIKHDLNDHIKILTVTRGTELSNRPHGVYQSQRKTNINGCSKWQLFPNMIAVGEHSNYSSFYWIFLFNEAPFT